MWIYFPNGYIFSSFIEERTHGARDTYDIAVLRYFERPAQGIMEKIKKFFFRKTRFISAVFVEKSEVENIPVEKEIPGPMLSYRYLPSAEMERLKRFVATLPRPKDLTVTITGFSSENSDKTKVEWEN